MSPAECLMPWINLDRVLLSDPTVTHSTEPTTLATPTWVSQTLTAHTEIVQAAQQWQTEQNDTHL